MITKFGIDYRQRVENALKELQAGKGILLVDDEDRENEGDIIFSAEKMTNADMALMIRECSGIVCLCLTNEKCQELELPPMVQITTVKIRRLLLYLLRPKMVLQQVFRLPIELQQ